MSCENCENPLILLQSSLLTNSVNFGPARPESLNKSVPDLIPHLDCLVYVPWRLIGHSDGFLRWQVIFTYISKSHNSSKCYTTFTTRHNIKMLAWLVWLLAVCAFAGAQHETLIHNCSTQADQISAALKVK